MAEPSDVVAGLVKTAFPDATNFRIRPSMNLPEGSIYYVDFDHGTEKDDFYYVLVGPSEHKLFEDAMDALDRLETLIRKRKSFWERLTEGSITDLVASIIALVVTVGFAIHTGVTGKPDQSLLAVFSLVLGYYFGKKTS